MKTLLQDVFSSKAKQYIDFSVCNFRVLSFHLKNLALSPAQKPHYILETYFIVLIIASYQNILIHPPPERDWSRKTKMGLYVVGMYLKIMNP